MLDAGLVDRPRRTPPALPSRIGTLVAIDLDREVVDAEAEQGGHDMLDGVDVVAGRIAQRGAEVGAADFGHDGADFAHGAERVGVVEDDAGVGVGGREADRNRLAAVDTEAVQGHPRFDRLSDNRANRSPFAQSARVLFRMPACQCQDIRALLNRVGAISSPIRRQRRLFHGRKIVVGTLGQQITLSYSVLPLTLV